MASFGENLRRERELRGVTLPELSNATKISLRHLQALENDRFDELPGGVFARGFVRGVARYLKLDERHWVGEFARAAHEEPEILARYAPPVAEPPAGSRRGVWSLLALLAVFVLGAYLVHETRLRRAAEASPVHGEPAVPVANRAAPASAPALEPARDTVVRPAPREPAPPEPVVGEPVPGQPAPARPVVAPAELRLQVDALEDAWVSVTVDGQPNYTGLMKPGESRTFRGRERIAVTTGNASAIVLTLNGETLPPLGNPGERKNLTLTAQDLKPPTP